MISAQTRLTLTDWAERAAVGASAACLAHCLVLPLLLAATPALTSVLQMPESVHLWMLAIAIPSAALALYQGCRRHGSRLPLIGGLIGLSLLALGAVALGETWLEVPFTVAGSVILVSAHLINWRLRHGCAC